MMNYLQLDEIDLNRGGALWTAREIAQQPESWIRTQELLRQHAAPIAAFLGPLLAQPDLRIGEGALLNTHYCLRQRSK